MSAPHHTGDSAHPLGITVVLILQSPFGGCDAAVTGHGRVKRSFITAPWNQSSDDDVQFDFGILALSGKRQETDGHALLFSTAGSQ